MQALVDGKINFIVECNPLLGELAAGLVKDVLAGQDVEKKFYVEDQSFTQEQAAEVIDSRLVLIRDATIRSDVAAPAGGRSIGSPADVPTPEPEGHDTTMPADTDVPPIVEMRGITIRFPGVLALDGVDFFLRPGEVHSLMGENGAGKSTLIKALTGVYPIDGGTITVAGEPRVFASTADAQAAGISTVYQEVNLCANLSVGENVMLGHEPRNAGGDRLEVGPPRGRTPPREPRPAHRHPLGAVEPLDRDPAARRDQPGDGARLQGARARRADLEPRPRRGRAALRASSATSATAASPSSSSATSSTRSTRSPTASRCCATASSSASTRRPTCRASELVTKMIGRELDDLAAISRTAEREIDRTAAPVLRARGVGRRGVLEPADLDVFDGEVVGIAGLLGSGRTELVRLLYGADRADTGTIEVDGRPARITSPRHAIDHRIAFSSEDRRAEGIIGDLTVAENIVLGIQARRGWLRRIRRAEQDAVVADVHEGARTCAPPTRIALAGNLSGGNQQKVLLARWLATAPELIILDEPTRGIDVGAKADIQRKVAELAEAGPVGHLHLLRARRGASPRPTHHRDARPPQDRRAGFAATSTSTTSSTTSPTRARESAA